MAVYDVNGKLLGNTSKIFKDVVDATLLWTISLPLIKQGACTDGVYLYQCHGEATTGTAMNVSKIQISDGTIIATAEFTGTPDFEHANDCTFNPNTNEVAVCTSLSDGSVIILDADDLSYKSTAYLTNAKGTPYSIWSLCYDRTRNCYYVVSGLHVFVYDAEWNYTREFDLLSNPTVATGSPTGQGIETDGNYIYGVTYNPNLITIRTVDGGSVKTLINSEVLYEPETMAYDWNGNYYIVSMPNHQQMLLYKVEMDYK